MRSAYVLESEGEFERLERQSALPQYDYKVELRGFQPRAGTRILDAGCGSGVVARYIAKAFPDCEVTGWDFSPQRIERARKESSKLANLHFAVQDLRGSEAERDAEKFDVIICRYVLHHLTPEDQLLTLKHFFHNLRSSGQLRIIELDGLYLNMQPQTPLVRKVLSTLENNPYADFRVGAKLPSLLTRAGFQDLQCRIEALNIAGNQLEGEIDIIQARFQQTRSALTSLLGSESKTLQFESEYISSLKEPGAVLFYNRFLVEGRRPKQRSLSLLTSAPTKAEKR